MDEKEKIYTIGSIAKITNLSKKMLMYCEEKGIVIPSMRGQNNNYRYYTEKQLEELLLIKELRRAGFSFENLSHIMKNRDLAHLRKEMVAKMKQQNAMFLDAINKLSAYNEILLRVFNASIDLEEKENGNLRPNFAPDEDAPFFFHSQEQYIISYPYYGRFNNRAIFMEKVAKLYELMERENLIATGPLMIIFHGNYLPSFSWEEGEVELCFPIERDDGASPHTRIMKSNLFLGTVFRGSYNQFSDIYNKLERWAAAHKLQLAGSSLEEYIISPMMTSNQDNYYTKLYLPVEGSNLK